MKSVKNHLSLVIALLSILFSIQVFIIVDRSIESYKENLATNYSVVLVAQKRVDALELKKENPIIADVTKLSPDNIIKRLDTGMSSKNIDFLKLTLPKFYKVKLKYFPSPREIKKLTSALLKNESIIKIESFSDSHDTTYKLLLLFKTVISAFSIIMIVVTILLIFKELRIWQFKHNERMSIMGLFGAPIWLRSAVLFRLAIVDALIASALAFMIFTIISSSDWVLEQFKNIGIEITIFNPLYDFLLLLLIAVVLSIMLASFIVLGHKEEV
jgi:cell division transport system permease protein